MKNQEVWLKCKQGPWACPILCVLSVQGGSPKPTLNTEHAGHGGKIIRQIERVSFREDPAGRIRGVFQEGGGGLGILW